MFNFLSLISNRFFWRFLSIIVIIILKIFYRIKIGKNCYFEGIPKLKLNGNKNESNIYIGDNVKFLGIVDFRLRENGKIIIDDNVVIEENCRFVSARNGTIHINSNTLVGSYAVWNGGGNITVGKKCAISSGSRFNANEHQNKKNQYIRDQGFDYGNILINDDCLIGTNVVILKNVNIKLGSIIGANSVVTKDTEEYSINGGVPSKCIKFRML
jgi:acetyltransferase-like isoleucine patch superfamily enzyme